MLPAQLTFRTIREMAPAAVARSLLGYEIGADVERVEARRDLMLPAALQVRLFHRPVPVGQRFCAQMTHQVTLFTVRHEGPQTVADDDSLQIQSTDRSSSFARAPGCRLSEGQQFAGLNVDADVAMRALDDLAAAQTQAAGRDRLPFRLTCRDEVERDPNRCRPGARNVLAHLPLQLACFVGLEDLENPLIIEVTLCPDMSEWRLTMREFGTRRARLSMLWKDIDPF